MMMIHNPWSTVQGDSNDMRKSAETMDKIKVSMIALYQRHTTKSAEEISALRDAETWMTADEAMDMGFAEVRDRCRRRGRHRRPLQSSFRSFHRFQRTSRCRSPRAWAENRATAA